MKAILKWIAVAGGYLSMIATLLGVSLATVLDDEPLKKWIALGVALVTLIFIGWCVYRATNREVSSRYPEGYLPLSSFIRHSTADGKFITFEFFRHIQIKRPCMTTLSHRFVWSGSQAPTCESDIQVAGDVKPVDGENARTLKLHFKRAKLYNDVEVAHIRMKIDDSDASSLPVLEQTVHAPISLICFKVELLHASAPYFGKKAVLSRQAIDGYLPRDELIDTVDFDASSKSYSRNITEPEPGYRYRLTWERPSA